ncbi:MAG: hypothetical protein SH847_23250 [Roseiflexaceae bacterium]|nr:hypothetical protein [Roseiflexaceae bacterium]
MIRLPALLWQRLTEAHRALAQYGVVPIWHRQALYAAFGNRSYGFEIKLESRPGEPTIADLQQLNQGFPVYEDRLVATTDRVSGQIRRTALILTTLEYANNYIQGWTYEEYQGQMLMFLNAIRAVAAGDNWEHFSFPHTGIGLFDAYEPGDIVYAATSFAWQNIIRDAEYMLYPLEPERDDDMLKPFRFDTAGLIAIALESQYTRAPRVTDHIVPHISVLTYWSWWLNEAVPQAWQVVPDNFA